MSDHYLLNPKVFLYITALSAQLLYLASLISLRRFGLKKKPIYLNIYSDFRTLQSKSDYALKMNRLSNQVNHLLFIVELVNIFY